MKRTLWTGAIMVDRTLPETEARARGLILQCGNRRLISYTERRRFPGNYLCLPGVEHHRPLQRLRRGSCWSAPRAGVTHGMFCHECCICQTYKPGEVELR